MGTTATSVLGAHPPSRSHLVIPQLLESSWGSKLTQPTANSPVPAVSRCFHIGIPRWVKCWVSRWWGRPEISGFFRFSIDANSPCQMLKVMVAFFSLHLPPKNFIHIVSPWVTNCWWFRNLAFHQLIWLDIPLFTRVYTSQVQDAFHQQYELLEPSYVLGIFLLFKNPTSIKTSKTRVIGLHIVVFWQTIKYLDLFFFLGGGLLWLRLVLLSGRVVVFYNFSTWFGPTQFHHQMNENQTSLDEEIGHHVFESLDQGLNCEPLKDRTPCFCASIKCQPPKVYQKS